jgi:WD40 repeat protein
LLRIIDGNNNSIISIAFSPDGQVIAAGSGDRVYNGVVRFWRVSDGTLLKYFNQDPNAVSYVTAVAYSPDGSLFSYARVDGLTVMAHNPLPPCSSSFAPSSQFFPSSGGSGSTNVAAPAGCNWTAISNESWIVITSPACCGSSTVTFDVRENTTSSARTGTMTIAGRTFTVVQDGGLGDHCNNTITPAYQTFPATGGAGAVNVSATTNRCAWHAVSNVSWVSITSGNGIGNGTVTYSVAANPGPGGRSGTITVGGQTFSVKQKGS